MTKEQLATMAKEAMERAYSPYSGYKVGAALICKDGSVYTGCNVENASFSATNCAERTAFFKAISEGKKAFAAIAICGGKDGVIEGLFPPCGVCRQVMREFCEDDFEIYLMNRKLDVGATVASKLQTREYTGVGCVKMNYTYILECEDGTYYTGWTNNLEKRLKDHNDGKGAKYTKARLPVVLVYHEMFQTKEEAMRREYAIKRMTRKEKEELMGKVTP